MGHPNALAYVALLAYPAIALLLFAVKRPADACGWTIMLGALFLPTMISIDLPVVPPLDSEGIPCLSALVCCSIYAKDRLWSQSLATRHKVLFIAMMIGTFFTSVTNTDPLHYGPVTVPGETLYDALAACVKTLTRWFVPFFLGYKMVTTIAELKQYFKMLVVACLIYSLFIFVELWMSPQWNRWIYGYHQTEYIQTIRWGGYRPKVFMRHGLNVALFVTIATLVACTMKRTGMKLARIGSGALVWFLVILLVMCKSSGTLVYAAVVVPVVLFFGYRGQLRLALTLASIEIGYPLLRAFGLIPVDGIVNFFREQIGEERAISLWFRFHTEQEILDRAMERFIFGWGGYQRSMILDPETGENLSIIDGYWAYEIGSRGLVGFLCVFGTLLVPVFVLRKQIKSVFDRQDRLLLSGLAVLVGLYVIDLFPNSSIHAYLTYGAGILAGLPRRVLQQQAYAAQQELQPFAANPFRGNAFEQRS